MKRSCGTRLRFGVGLKRAVGSTHIVTVDFNPPKLQTSTKKKAVGSEHFIAGDFNPRQHSVQVVTVAFHPLHRNQE